MIQMVSSRSSAAMNCRPATPSTRRQRAAAYNAARRALTMIEMAIVIMILAIFAAAAMPTYSKSLARFRMDATTRMIIADLSATRARASAMSMNQSIIFTPSANQYQIAGMTAPDRPGTTYTVKLSDPPFQATLNSASFGNSSTLTFDGYGVPSSAGTIAVTVGTLTKTITVDPDTAAATVQ